MCVFVSSDSTLPSVYAPQGDMEPEPSRGAQCSVAVRRLGTSGSATGKNHSFHDSTVSPLLVSGSAKNVLLCITYEL